jgi:hypothetical protein
MGGYRVFTWVMTCMADNGGRWSGRRARPILLGALALFTALVVPSIAHANAVSYTCGANPPVTIKDGESADKATPRDIIVTSFVCDEVVDSGGNVWSARGAIRAQYLDGTSEAAVVEIYNSTWTSAGPNLVVDTFAVTHYAPLIGGAASAFWIDGTMSHRGIALVDLVNVLATVDIVTVASGVQFLGSLGAFVGAGADPIDFGDEFDWLNHLDSVGQIATLHFYLGTAYDSFQLSGPDRFMVVTG